MSCGMLSITRYAIISDQTECWCIVDTYHARNLKVRMNFGHHLHLRLVLVRRVQFAKVFFAHSRVSKLCEQSECLIEFVYIVCIRSAG